MQTIQPNELYTDKGQFAVMTRTRILSYAKLASIAGHLRRNAEDLLFTSNPPGIDNCRIAEEMLGFALTLAPERIGARFDY